MYVRIYVFVDVCMYERIFVSMYAGFYVCMSMCTQILICVFVYLCMYVLVQQIWVHQYTHML